MERQERKLEVLSIAPWHTLLLSDVAHSVEIMREAQCERDGGHDWEDLSVMGPDGGTEIHSCRTCGTLWQHTWY